MGSFDQLHSDPFDLQSYLNNKLLRLEDSSENIVLFTPKKEQK
jgi:hypothetical protein